MDQFIISVGYRGIGAAIKAVAALLTLSVSLFVAGAAADDSPSPLIVAFGDSLTAGYGLEPGAAFPNQLEAALQKSGFANVDVRNAGVSGDTSAGGRSRLIWNLSALGAVPDLLILELGANDALRGIAPQRTRANIRAILAELESRNIPVLLTGMQAPPNLGNEYGAEFNVIFPDLAKEFAVPLYPFFLEGVAANAALNQDDGIHPTKAGVAVIVESIMPAVLSALTPPAGQLTAAK